MIITIKQYPFYFILSFIISLSIFSCKKGNASLENEVEQQKEKEVNNKLHEVYLFVSAKNQEALDYMNVLDFSELVGQPGLHYSKEMRGDTLDIILPGVTKPQIVEIMAFGKPAFYNTRVLIKPQDSLYLHLENGEISFYKTNAIENNFFTKITTPETKWPNFDGDIATYKKDVVAIYSLRKDIFEDYIKTHPEVSETFKSNIAAEMKYEYLFQLANPRSIKPSGTSTVINNFNNGEGLLSTLRTSRYDSEKNMLDFKSYYDDITIEDFQKPEYINNDYFKRSLNQLIRHYFAEYDYLNYSKETFLAEKKFIDENLDGEIKTYALGKLIYDYNEKGFGRGSQDIEILKTAITELKNRTDKPSYVEIMHTIQTSIEIIGNGIPDHILKEKLLTTSLDTITVGDVLQNTKGRIRTLDFWASWCAPCIKEIKTTKAFKEELASEYEADWIYISADEVQEDWLKKTKKLQKYIPESKHYRFIKPFKSKLLKLLKARKHNRIYVPRYTILDPNNNVSFAIAPYPSDSITFKKAIQQVTSME